MFVVTEMLYVTRARIVVGGKGQSVSLCWPPASLHDLIKEIHSEDSIKGL